MMLSRTFARFPGMEGRDGGQWMGVGSGDLGLGDLGGCYGVSNRNMDLWWKEEWLFFEVESNGLESCR